MKLFFVVSGYLAPTCKNVGSSKDSHVFCEAFGSAESAKAVNFMSIALAKIKNRWADSFEIWPFRWEGAISGFLQVFKECI